MILGRIPAMVRWKQLKTLQHVRFPRARAQPSRFSQVLVSDDL